MSLARAFTTRRNKSDMRITAPIFIGRAASQRGGKPVDRAQISSPVVLVSTSNALLHDAQEIPGTTAIEIRSVSGSSAASTTSSGEDSDGSSNASVHSRTNTLTDASSVDESPSPITPEPNHLSCYFKPNVDTQSKHSSTHSRSASARESLEAPILPKRVPSHSKKAHENLHRKRSVQRMLSPASSARESLRNSAQMQQNNPSAFVEAPRDGPFGRELAQLDEVAEEFGNVVRDAETDADLKVIKTYDLAQYGASDYMAEIQGLIYATFVDDSPNLDMGGWI